MKLLINNTRFVSLSSTYKNRHLSLAEDEVLTQWANDNLEPTDNFKIVADNYTIQPTLEELKTEALKALDEEFEKQVVELTGNKPNAERQMWMLINLSAKAFLGGDETKREFLEAQVPPLKKAELIQAGEDIATWKANDAASKEAVTSQVVQMAMGMKKTAEEAIKAAETHEELAATIETLKAQEVATIDAFKAAIAPQQT